MGPADDFMLSLGDIFDLQHLILNFKNDLAHIHLHNKLQALVKPKNDPAHNRVDDELQALLCRQDYTSVFEAGIESLNSLVDALRVHLPAHQTAFKDSSQALITAIMNQLIDLLLEINANRDGNIAKWATSDSNIRIAMSKLSPLLVNQEMSDASFPSPSGDASSGVSPESKFSSPKHPTGLPSTHSLAT
ncbi:hypothetical protein LTR84_005595 [Exophiala bonariae]|uniref:NACHT-NTPase and P-loop NTPases N-terminal domain-containing protein n=1 Tax=Exophiala bonariae TaxID=1690606 RepID=A0AAV9N512_9EURO|nr:hypothetical protein LTR84_005595 [Exophiala bonariae]